jgi:Flp pilus assembly protein TadG
MSAGTKLRALYRPRVAGARAPLRPPSRGNVAMIFALTLIPLCFAVGAGLDYARAVVVRANMSEAIDAAALAVGATTGLTTAQMQTLAQQYFTANYKADASYGTPAAIVVTHRARAANRFTISVTRIRCRRRCSARSASIRSRSRPPPKWFGAR